MWCPTTMRLPILFITSYVCEVDLVDGYERLWIYHSYLIDVKAASVNGGHRAIIPSYQGAEL
jgi:hypothetical protein